MKNPELITIAGTRPELIKLSRFIQLMRENNGGGHSHALLYTGQHYSANMKDIFFDELGIEAADYDLKSNTSDVGQLKGGILSLLERIRPRYVILYGDTNSTMAGALAAQEIGAGLIHIEAGIRDFDLTIPEERVRIYIDSVSDHLLAPTELARTFLEYEQVQGRIAVPGNLISDVCTRMAELAEEKERRLPEGGSSLPGEYLLLTMHRQENVDDPDRLLLLRKHLGTIKDRVVFPVHPRTRNNLARYGISLPENVVLIDAVGYLEFLRLLKNCKLVMTDSGGVTEEAMILKKPCITLRHSTARWETILMKANVLFPLERKDPLGDVIEQMLQVRITGNPYGTDVAEKTVRLVNEIASPSSSSPSHSPSYTKRERGAEGEPIGPISPPGSPRLGAGHQSP
ncbi:UDP-N-acetylglucosamine 2-epimerase (non-hydrolyzing) [Nitrososphaera sp.]|uniref:non-hydrolyzing UDP-N-acetylglucosamine 2-epimerase n=1 Tax=Nitrososphaera sp. TaxID=1971748 RepID=UPI00307F0295